MTRRKSNLAGLPRSVEDRFSIPIRSIIDICAWIKSPLWNCLRYHSRFHSYANNSGIHTVRITSFLLKSIVLVMFVDDHLFANRPLTGNYCTGCYNSDDVRINSTTVAWNVLKLSIDASFYAIDYHLTNNHLMILYDCITTRFFQRTSQ